MDKLPDFHLTAKFPLSKLCIEKDLRTFSEAYSYIKRLRYGRNSKRGDFASIISEGRGTCSTKHAFLKQLAMESSIQTINLYIGIYKMDGKNTPGIGSALDQFEIDFIPEAHSYLKIDGTIHDVTTANSHRLKFKDSLLLEEKILPHQIGDYKLEFHQAFLKNWIENNTVPYSFEEIWTIREACISQLSQ